MIKTFFTALSLAGWGTKLAVAGVVIATLGTAYGIWHYTIFSKGWSTGYDRALADVAKQDQKAIARAKEYRGAVLDCRGRGLRWSQASGQCSER